MKLFLVEDEVIALQSLQRKIEDLDGAWQVVGTASNGAQALALIAQARPDVVLTDIRMPDMDGIALIECLRERGSPILPVIISGYQEFAYAKQAVRLGVEDYLLKPVDPVELAGCLAHCESRLKSMRSHDNIASFLVGEDRISLEFSPGESHFAVVYLIVGNALSNLEYVQHPSVSYMQSAAMEHLLAPLLPAHTSVHCMDGFFSNEKAFVFSGSGIAPRTLQAALEQSATALRQETGHCITMFYQTTNHQDKLESSIRICRRGALENVFFGRDVITDKSAPTFVADKELGERVRLFTLFLRQNEQDALYKQAKKMVEDWNAAQRRAVEISTDLVFILNALKQSFPVQKGTSFYSIFFVENLISFSQTTEDLSQGLAQLLWELFRPEPDERAASAEEMVQQIELYFKDNLSESLSLQSLSDKMGLSKVYLCRIFKRQKDMTPIDYFTRMKIDRARALIAAHPAMPLREIADALGFNDTYYFSKVFKRITGVPPSELRDEK